MIQLDEKHWVRSADEVAAVWPIFIPSPDPYDMPNRRSSIVDPERCMVLIGGTWSQIERGVDAVARILNQS